MAGSRNLTMFYVIIGVIALGGIGWIWSQRSGMDAGVEITPVAPGSFEGYTVGREDAPVEVIEFADFQCPACARSAILTIPDVMQRLVRGGLVKYHFKDLPLDIHPNARTAALAAACSDEQGHFWEMHDQLFYNQNDWAPQRRVQGTFRDYAETLGLDMSQFRECMSSRRYAARIESTVQEALALGVASTPSYVIGGRLYAGSMPFDKFRSIVDSLAARAN